MPAKKHRPGKFSKDAREQKNLVKDSQNKMFHEMIAILGQTLPEFKKLCAQFSGPDFVKVYDYDFLVEIFTAASESCGQQALSQKIDECEEKIKTLEAELEDERSFKIKPVLNGNAASPPCLAAFEKADETSLTDSGLGSPTAAPAKTETKLVKQLNSEINLLHYQNQNLQKNLDHSEKLLERFKAKFSTAHMENKKLRQENEKLKRPTETQSIIEKLEDKIHHQGIIIDNKIKQIKTLKGENKTLADKISNLTTENFKLEIKLGHDSALVKKLKQNENDNLVAIRKLIAELEQNRCFLYSVIRNCQHCFQGVKNGGKKIGVKAC